MNLDSGDPRNRRIITQKKVRYSHRMGLHLDNALTELQSLDSTSKEEYSSRNTVLPDDQPNINVTPVKEIVAFDDTLKEGCYPFSDTDKLAIFTQFEEDLEGYTDGQEVIAFDVPIQAIVDEHVAPLDAKSGNRILLVDELDVLLF